MRRLSVLLALVITVCVETPAIAGSIFKTEPSTEAEKVVGKVLETLAAKDASGDARGAADLFTEDGVAKYFFGLQNEPKTAEGRMKVYIVRSGANVSNREYRDVTIMKIEGDKAEASGSYRAQGTAFGFKFVRTANIHWMLRREPDGQWRIHLEEWSNPELTRQ